MFGKLLALFIVVPLVELFILIRIGEFIGAWYTVGLVIATGIIGATLARFEGLRVWQRLHTDLRQLKMPTDKIIEGALVLIGGIVLLTPGILTDTLGFMLIIPFTRIVFVKIIKKRFASSIKNKTNSHIITIESDKR